MPVRFRAIVFPNREIYTINEGKAMSSVFAFQFQGYSSEELIKYSEWENSQKFHPCFPDNLKVQAFNTATGSNYDPWGLLPNTALLHQSHLLQCKAAGLMNSKDNQKIAEMGRVDGYWKQPRKKFQSKDEQFIYDYYYSQKYNKVMCAQN